MQKMSVSVLLCLVMLSIGSCNEEIYNHSIIINKGLKFMKNNGLKFVSLVSFVGYGHYHTVSRTQSKKFNQLNAADFLSLTPNLCRYGEISINNLKEDICGFV